MIKCWGPQALLHDGFSEPGCVTMATQAVWQSSWQRTVLQRFILKQGPFCWRHSQVTPSNPHTLTDAHTYTHTHTTDPLKRFSIFQYLHHMDISTVGHHKKFYNKSKICNPWKRFAITHLVQQLKHQNILQTQKHWSGQTNHGQQAIKSEL